MPIIVKFTPAPDKIQLKWDGADQRTVDYRNDETVADLIHRLDLTTEEIQVVAVNGIVCGQNKKLSDGDRVRLFPIAAGG